MPQTPQSQACIPSTRIKIQHVLWVDVSHQLLGGKHMQESSKRGESSRHLDGVDVQLLHSKRHAARMYFIQITLETGKIDY
jgi:hypothetical protein